MLYPSLNFRNSELLLSITTTASPQTFTLPMNPIGTYSATIDWGDGSTSEITAYDDADLAHNYVSAGSYTIALTGFIGGIYFNSTGDRFLVDSVHYKNATRIERAFSGCSNLLSFNGKTSGITDFSFAWFFCSNLTAFPLINTSSVTDFQGAWQFCSSLTSFPLIDTSSGKNFSNAWLGCSSLTAFPASFFDSWTGIPVNFCFVGAWDGCTSLTPQSVENILVSIDTSGQSAPASGVDITIDYNGTGLTAATTTAITNLKGKGWTITINGVLQ